MLDVKVGVTNTDPDAIGFVGVELANHCAVPVAIAAVIVAELPEQITEPLATGADGGPEQAFEHVNAAENPAYVTETSDVNRKVRTPAAFDAIALGGNVKPVYCPISGAAVEFPS